MNSQDLAESTYPVDTERKSNGLSTDASTEDLGQQKARHWSSTKGEGQNVSEIMKFSHLVPLI